MKYLLILCSFAVFTTFQSTAEIFRVMLHTGSFPPYFFEQGDSKTGIIKDVFTAIAQETGDSFEFVRVPFKRALRQFETGKIDIEPMTNPIFRQSSSIPSLYSLPYATAEDTIVFHVEAYRTINSPEGLFKETIGTVKGYHYPEFDTYFEKGYMKAYPLESENKLMKLLLANRLKQIIINKDYAQYQIKLKQLNNVVRLGPSYHQLDMMIRFHPNKEHAIVRFNTAIQKLLKDGDIKRIYDRYR
jgi:polar amino acid transport system substrate-binding protein